MTISPSTWPLFGLSLQVDDLRLTVPQEDELLALAGLVKEGLHDASVMPFSVGWTDATPEEAAQRYLRWNWRIRATWQPENWTLAFAVRRDGVLVGSKSIHAVDMQVRREVGTGSWLGRRHQGRGTGRLMREAVLALMFQGLGAEWAVSEAFADNVPSCRVNEGLGYSPDGISIINRRGVPTVLNRYRLSSDEWSHRNRPAVEVSGLEQCRDWFAKAT